MQVAISVEFALARTALPGAPPRSSRQDLWAAARPNGVDVKLPGTAGRRRARAPHDALCAGPHDKGLGTSNPASSTLASAHPTSQKTPSSNPHHQTTHPLTDAPTQPQADFHPLGEGGRGTAQGEPVARPRALTNQRPAGKTGGGAV